MMRKVFVDASAWIAVVDREDMYYPRASEQYKLLLNDQVQLATTSLVMAEAYVVLQRKIGYYAAMAFLKGVNQSSRVDVYYPDARSEVDAKEILERYADQDFSLADAVSFVFMRQSGISEAFTYDRHFAAAGFILIG